MSKLHAWKARYHYHFASLRVCTSAFTALRSSACVLCFCRSLYHYLGISFRVMSLLGWEERRWDKKEWYGIFYKNSEGSEWMKSVKPPSSLLLRMCADNRHTGPSLLDLCTTSTLAPFRAVPAGLQVGIGETNHVPMAAPCGQLSRNLDAREVIAPKTIRIIGMPGDLSNFRI